MVGVSLQSEKRKRERERERELGFRVSRISDPDGHIVFPRGGSAERRPCGSGTRAELEGLLRELNPGPLAPEARIMPLDQAAG